jgi:hypothetical protein
MKLDNKDTVNFKIKDFRQHVAKKRSAIAAVALLFIPIFILTVLVTSGYSMDQKKSLVWMGFHPGKAKVYRDRSPKTWGFSIRCVK